MTSSTVVALAVIAFLVKWDSANKIITTVAAAAGVAAVGVAIWTILAPNKITSVRVTNTGDATAHRGGRANTGAKGAFTTDTPMEIEVDGTGRAEAPGGNANTGLHIQSEQ